MASSATNPLSANVCEAALADLLDECNNNAKGHTRHAAQTLPNRIEA